MSTNVARPPTSQRFDRGTGRWLTELGHPASSTPRKMHPWAILGQVVSRTTAGPEASRSAFHAAEDQNTTRPRPAMDAPSPLLSQPSHLDTRAERRLGVFGTGLLLPLRR